MGTEAGECFAGRVTNATRYKGKRTELGWADCSPAVSRHRPAFNIFPEESRAALHSVTFPLLARTPRSTLCSDARSRQLLLKLSHT